MNKQLHDEFYQSIYQHDRVTDQLWQLKQLEYSLFGRCTNNTVSVSHHIIDSWARGKSSEQLDELVNHEIMGTLALCLCETLNFVRPTGTAMNINPYYDLLLADKHLTMDNLEHCIEIIKIHPKLAYKFVMSYGPTSMDHYMPFKTWVEQGWQAVINPTAQLPGLLLRDGNAWLLAYAQAHYQHMELVNGSLV